MHTEQTLPQQAEVANLLALLRYRLQAYAHDAITAAVREYLQEKESIQLQKCMIYVALRLNIT